MSFSLFSLTIYFIIAAIGFMMGYLFKHAKTSAETFSPNPKIVLKIYMLSFVVALVTTYALSYFATHSLVTSASPEEGDINYHNERSLMIFALNFFFFILVFLSNFYSQSVRKLTPIPYLLTFLFYAIFILKDTYYVSGYYLIWQDSLQLLKGEIPDFEATGWVKCLLGFNVTAFNAFMIWWGFRK
ncbi:MAG: hypothetical protein IPP77_04575 [Bacteroidetes bacterium]|nr:hypothetical protein [Bacteroidota bacterium]